MKLHTPRLRRFVLSAGLYCLSGSVAVQAVIISIDPSFDYLGGGAGGEPATPAVPIDLVALGFQEGDIVRLDQLGDFSPRPGYEDDRGAMSGVFSSSSFVSDALYAERVEPVFTQNDIPQDFAISLGSFTGLDVKIPTGARYLFVAPINQTPGGGSDPDGDYALRINAASIPDNGQALMMLALSLGGVALWNCKSSRARAGIEAA